MSEQASHSSPRNLRGLTSHQLKFGAAVLLALIGIAISDWLAGGWMELWTRYLLAAILALNLWSAFQLWQDKRAAIRNDKKTENDFRIPERRLLLYDLFGGWPAGLIIKQLIRHKTEKRSYRIKSWLAIFLNITAVGLFTCWRLGWI